MNHKTKSLLFGLVAGALLGVTFAWVASDGEPDDDGRLALTSLGPAEFITLGISVLTLARQFSGMVKRA
ncbi:MAG: hypothetical protein KDD78_08175 [Caldilineaceae bacterium]|nr:hypothetical protein [Caldilineaceae bacterium]